MSEIPPQNSAGGHRDPGDPNTPVDYPADPGPLPPLYPPPGYPAGYPAYPGYDPYRPAKPLGTNGKAVAALVCAVVGLMCCGLPSVAGLALGAIAIRETKRTGQDGYGLALAGAIIGGVATAGFVLLILLWIGVFASGFSLV